MSLIEALQDSEVNRERAMLGAREAFNEPSTHVVSQAVLSRSSSEWVTNIVMDYGDSVLYTVEVCEGAAFPHAKPRVDLAVWGLREHILTLFLRGLMADTSD